MSVVLSIIYPTHGHIMRGVHVSTEGTKVFKGTLGTYVFLVTCSKRPYQANTRPMANAERVWQLTGILTMRFVFINVAAASETLPVRTVPRGLGRDEGYGDIVVTVLERADTATLDAVAEMMGIPTPPISYHATLVLKCLYKSSHTF
jgi:hypothetical protein